MTNLTKDEDLYMLNGHWKKFKCFRPCVHFNTESHPVLYANNFLISLHYVLNETRSLDYGL